MNKADFLALIETSFKKEALKKLIFSRPKSGEISKISCRLVAHRGRRLLAMEFSLPGDTVSHRNLGEDELPSELVPIIDNYKQVNLITTYGDAELKCSKSGKETVMSKDLDYPFEPNRHYTFTLVMKRNETGFIFDIEDIIEEDINIDLN